MPNIELNNWLQAPPLPEEIKGDEVEGFFLGIDTVKIKLKTLEDRFGVWVDYSNFSHLVFYDVQKNLYASGSLEVALRFEDGPVKKFVGAATFNVAEYYPNGHYAATLKSLCISNAMLEYPQFGGLLNKGLERVKPEPPTKIDAKVARMKTLIDSATTKKELLSYEAQCPAELKDHYQAKLKQLKK